MSAVFTLGVSRHPGRFFTEAICPTAMYAVPPIEQHAPDDEDDHQHADQDGRDRSHAFSFGRLQEHPANSRGKKEHSPALPSVRVEHDRVNYSGPVVGCYRRGAETAASSPHPMRRTFNHTDTKPGAERRPAALRGSPLAVVAVQWGEGGISLGQEGWCRSGDSNPEPLRAQTLNLARLAIPPLRHGRGPMISPGGASQENRMAKTEYRHQPPRAARVRDPRDGRGRAGAARDRGEVSPDRPGDSRTPTATVRNGEPLLLGCHISRTAHGTDANHDPDADRKLLLHAREISRLAGKAAERGLTIVPLKLYLQGRTR